MSKFQTISPVDGRVYVERNLATAAEIQKALDESKVARQKWKATPLPIRKAICKMAIDNLVANSDLLGEELTWQMGRPIKYTPYEITGGLKDRAYHMCDIADRALADIGASEKDGFKRFIRREPLGTVLVLAPWNYPYLTSVNVIIPALLAGNCVILKHAQQTPLVAERYTEAFEEAGIPEGVFQHLHLDHGQVAKVIESDQVDFVAFTGSVSGGQAVKRVVGQKFISSGLELGGKDPAYVRNDANFDHAVANLVDGSFFNSGQSCCGIERIYVHQDIHERFVEAFVASTKKYNLGNPTDPNVDLGPMVKTSAANYAKGLIDQAVNKGARSLIDPNLFAAHKWGTPYMAPHVLTKVNHQMDLMTEEAFAPVVGIMSVKDDAEAIQMMNDSQFGLTASIWTKDLERAETLGNQVETGTLFMNRCDYLDPELAWTGIKNSGKGATLSALGFESLTRPKSFHLRYKL